MNPRKYSRGTRRPHNVRGTRGGDRRFRAGPPTKPKRRGRGLLLLLLLVVLTAVALVKSGAIR